MPPEVELGVNGFRENSLLGLDYSNYLCVVRTSHTMVQEQPSKYLPFL